MLRVETRRIRQTEEARRKIERMDEFLSLSGGLVFGKYELAAKQRNLEAERELQEQAEGKELEIEEKFTLLQEQQQDMEVRMTRAIQRALTDTSQRAAIGTVARPSRLAPLLKRGE